MLLEKTLNNTEKQKFGKKLIHQDSVGHEVQDGCAIYYLHQMDALIITISYQESVASSL